MRLLTKSQGFTGSTSTHCSDQQQSKQSTSCCPTCSSVDASQELLKGLEDARNIEKSEMTTTASLRPPLPPHLQPGKSTATAQRSTLSATANNTPSTSRSSSHARSPKAAKANNNAEFASEKATVALIRRWLCPTSPHGDATAAQKPIDELLPPLTSSNEADLQLYAIIAVIIKDFVYSWYSKITPDHVFVDEIVQIIAHCTRALEQRLRRVDLAELVLDEIPAIIDAHIKGTCLAASQGDILM